MRISSQLVTAGPNQASNASTALAPNAATASTSNTATTLASNAATALPAASVPTFHEAFRKAAVRGETTGKLGVDSRLSSDQSAVSDGDKTAGGTDVESSATPVSAQSGAQLFPVVESQSYSQAFVTATYDFLSGKAELSAKAGDTTTAAAPGSIVQVPAARTGDSKSKKSSLVGDSTDAATLPVGAPASTPAIVLLAADPILPPPSAPVNDVSTSGSVSAGGPDYAVAGPADSSVLDTSSTTNLLVSAPASQETAGPAAPTEGESPAVAVAAIPAALLPATASGDLVADAGRFAEATPPKGVSARPGLVPTSNTKPATETAPSSKVSAPPVSNGVEATPAPLAALGSAQTATLPQAAAALVPTSAAGADRSSTGEVRSKHKEATADSSVPDRDSITTVPAPFVAKLAEAQAPAQGGANGADVASLPKPLDGTQPLTPSISPAPPQTNLPPASVTLPAAATPSAPAALADASADSPVLAGASSAQLIQSAGQTEMRLGMRSAEFGNISISTSVSHQAISAQIALDHSELGRALAMHLPAIEEKLGSAYGLHARVEVRDESAASRPATDSGQQGGGSQEQTGRARGGQSRNGSAVSSVSEGNTGKAGFTSVESSSPSLAAPAERSRLDVRI